MFSPGGASLEAEDWKTLSLRSFNGDGELLFLPT